MRKSSLLATLEGLRVYAEENPLDETLNNQLFLLLLDYINDNEIKTKFEEILR